MTHGFISDGRLYVYREQAGVKEIESHFVRDKQERSERMTHSHGWKSQCNAEDPFYNSNVVWGRQSSAGLTTGYRFKDVIVPDENILYYTLSNGVVTGLFEYDLKDDFETRLFHKNDLISRGIDFSKKRGEFVLAVQDVDGRVNLELLNSRGSSTSILTGGDSRDCYPSFSQHNPNHVLFQSAGIARDEEGYAMMYGPEAIYRYDSESEELVEVLADEHYDFLLPREDAKGNLYCIRRPYQLPGQTSLGKQLLNALLFPVHFVSAVVGFLEAFTKLFNQQAFKANGPAVQSEQKDKYANVLGQTIHLAKLQRNRSSKDPSLVPGSWELLCISANKECKVIARNVASYDIDNDGTLYFTNGYRVNSLTAENSTMLFKHNMIEFLKTSPVA